MKLLLIATIALAALALFAMTARAVPADDVTVAAGDDAADLATDRWSEVQIPIRAATNANEAKPANRQAPISRSL